MGGVGGPPAEPFEFLLAMESGDKSGLAELGEVGLLAAERDKRRRQRLLHVEGRVRILHQREDAQVKPAIDKLYLRLWRCNDVFDHLGGMVAHGGADAEARAPRILRALLCLARFSADLGL